MLRLRVLRVCARVCVSECVWLRLLTKSRMRLGLEAWAGRECVCVCLALSKFHFANKAPKWASEFAPLKSAHKSQQQDEQGPAPVPVPGLGLDHISECVCQLFMSVCVCVCCWRLGPASMLFACVYTVCWLWHCNYNYKRKWRTHQRTHTPPDTYTQRHETVCLYGVYLCFMYG